MKRWLRKRPAKRPDPPCVGCKDPKRPPVPESLLSDDGSRLAAPERFEPQWRDDKPK